jgi:hypothetical protein
MTGRTRLLPLLCGILVWGACGLPTDASSDLQVTVLNDEVQLLVGGTEMLRTQVSGASGGVDPHRRYASTDESIVRVGQGGLLLGVGRGEAHVIVTLTSFEGAGADTATVRVTEEVRFDSVTPSSVSFGEVITIVGTALDPAGLAALSVAGWPAPVKSFTPGDFADPTSRDTLKIWTPAGANLSASLLALRKEGASATWPLTVQQQDLHEPNEESPARIDGPEALTNPQLAFEPGTAYDWYRIGGMQGTFTVEVMLRVPMELILGKTALSAPRDRRDDAPEWSVSEHYAHCRGLEAVKDRAYYLDENVSDKSIWIPVLDPQEDSLDLSVELFVPPADPLAYSIEVHDGYVTPVPRDEFEPNNHCAQATEVESGFRGTLSLDRSTDDDWFRFTAEEESTVQLRLTCVRCEDGPHFAGLTLFRDSDEALPEEPGQLPLIKHDWTGGDFLSMQATVPPGDYFVMVYNYFFQHLSELELEIDVNPRR